MGELRVMGRRGDDRILWNADVPAEVARAEEFFKKAMRANCMAFKATPDGSPGQRITAFDPQAERIVITPQMAGGSR